MFCQNCGHDLKEVTTGACPACELAFDPADPRTFALKPPKQRPRWWRITRTVIHTVVASAYFVALYGVVFVVAGWLLVEWLRATD